MNSTREIDLRPGALRAAHRNAGTRMFIRGHEQARPPSCEVAFVTAYATVKTVCKGQRGPGLAVFAVDDEGVVCSATFRAKSGSVQTAVVGRHTGADVFLPDDPSVSLRHLAIVVRPHRQTERLAYHVIDLRTDLGFCDERGIPAEHLLADGPLFVQIGRYALLLFPTGDPRIRWPDDPLEAFTALPTRHYSVEASSAAHHRNKRADPGATAVQIIGGARFADPAPDLHDTPLGALKVDSDTGATSFVVGANAARGGVLLGRYERCDSHGSEVLSDDRISRVHLLLLSVDDDVHAIDVASTNGVWLDKSSIRATRMGLGDHVELGRGVARVHWGPVH